jgi:hypothetical protein
MTKTIGTILALGAVLLVACEHGNQAPGALPQMGTYTSNVPGMGCADGAINCAIIPDPYGVTGKKPEDKSPPTLTVPDYKDGVISASPGNAVSFLIQTTHATSITADCVPATTVTISANSSTSESQIFFLGKMPNQDVTCTLTATGPNGSAASKVTLHPKAGAGANAPVFKGIPDNMAIKHGTTKSVSNITVNNVAPGAKPATVSCKTIKPTLTQVADGSYTFTFTQSQPPDEIDLCTFLAVNPDGEFGTFVTSISSTPVDPIIVPLNFKADVPLIMGHDNFKCKMGANYAYVDEACQVAPQFTIVNPDGVKVIPSISCSGKFKLASEDHITVVSYNNPVTYQMVLHYSESGTPGTTETCKIMINKDLLDDSGKQDENYPYYEFNMPTLKW